MHVHAPELVADYEALAAEYYDASRHPTCANFREASQLIIESWLDPTSPDTVFCDVGAGRSLLAEIQLRRSQSLARTIVIDDSPGMLAHSAPFHYLGATLVRADITRLIPLSNESVDILVASLGDPYNVDAFWAECNRVVRAGGLAFYTTPSFEWAIAFRENEAGGPNTAEFVLADGRSMYVPSYVYSEGDQAQLVGRCGFAVSKVRNVPLSAIRQTTISPKLFVGSGPVSTVVTGYALTKAWTQT